MSERTNGIPVENRHGAEDGTERLVAATLAAAMIAANNPHGGVTAEMAAQAFVDVAAELRKHQGDSRDLGAHGAEDWPSAPQSHQEAGMRS